MERYDPQAIEEKWQRVWEDERAFHTPNPAPGEEADERHWYQLEMLPYPSGTLHMGHVLNYTMGDVLTHLRRRSGWKVLRPMGFDSFGLPAENAAIRDGGHPREITERYIVGIRDADEAARLGDRLGPRGLGAPARVLPLDAVAVPAVLRARPRVPEGGAGQLVPERPDRRGQRVRHRRPLRALRRRGGSAQPRAVVLQDHRLRRRAARVRPAARRRVARADEDDPAQLDRALGGRGDHVPHRRAGRRRARLHDPAGHAVRRDVLRAGARAPARRAHRRRRRSGLRQADGGAERRGTGDRGEDRRLHRLPRDEPRQRRAAARLRRRLRAHGVRHGRDHGRAGARRARPRVRGSVRPAHRRGRDGGRRPRQLRQPRRDAGRRGREGDRRIAARRKARRSLPCRTACATGASRGSATGVPRFPSSTATTAVSSPCRTTSCHSCFRKSRTSVRRAWPRSPPTRSG